MSDAEHQGEVREPDNSTVDDWFGQNVARDQDVADRASVEADSEADAEAIFDAEADGQDRYEKGHPRPADETDEPGDVVGDPD